mmetsp:Transcript_16447/g.50357  ORF Transcript_16447/g.50357 Transcript_16447/m.50357 type:complete len:207 (+) Transcript_16447:1121-1741(+)
MERVAKPEVFALEFALDGDAAASSTSTATSKLDTLFSRWRQQKDCSLYLSISSSLSKSSSTPRGFLKAFAPRDKRSVLDPRSLRWTDAAFLSNCSVRAALAAITFASSSSGTTIRVGPDAGRGSAASGSSVDPKRVWCSTVVVAPFESASTSACAPISQPASAPVSEPAFASPSASVPSTTPPPPPPAFPFGPFRSSRTRLPMRPR